MTDRDWLTQRFEENRARLRAIALRMLGSQNDAEDAVQEAWLRLYRSDSQGIQNIEGWLTTVTGRVCLDMLRSRKTRGEQALHLSEADLAGATAHRIDLQGERELADSVGLALLVVLETLSPQERLAFVLHDMFAISFEEIASVVGCSVAAARQLASRARRRVQGSSPDRTRGLSQQRRVVDEFLAAARGGDFAGLIAVLDPHAVLRIDQGAVREIHGSQTIAGKAIMFARAAADVEQVLLNGVVGVVSRRSDEDIFSLMQFVMHRDLIVEIDVVTDRDRLRELTSQMARLG